ncbi:MAG: YceI family protein, partial [Acidimicrobiales bacterium]
MTHAHAINETDISGDYELDAAHSRLGFAVKHAMVTTVRGQFKSFRGQVHIDAQDPAKSSAGVEIDVDSISTGNDQRDAHLRTADFFEADKFPKMTFVSTHAERVKDDEYRMEGDLTVRGVTHVISFDLTYTGSALDPMGNFRAGFESTATISRKDFGLHYNAQMDDGGWLIGDRVK